MQRGRVLNLGYCNVLLKFALKNRLLILVFLLFIIGFSVGIFSAGNYEVIDSLNKSTLEAFFEDRQSATFFAVALDSFLSSMLFIVLCFGAGGSVLGLPLVPLAVLFNAFLRGGFTALLYSTYSLKGIAIHAVMILPSYILFVLALLLSACQSVEFSLKLVKTVLPSSLPSNLSLEFKSYCGKYFLFSLLVLVSALVDALLSCNFLERFLS